MRKLLILTAAAICALAGTVRASLVDTTFNPGTGAGGGILEQALPLPDGHILICGNFTSFNGKNRSYVARLNSDGSVDESFLAQPGYWVRNMALQADGKIVIGGYFTTVQGVPRNLVARLNSDGSLDTSFNPGLGARDIIAGGVDGNMDPFVFWVAVQPDQKIIITGNFRNYNGASSTGIVRINPDGSRDTSFDVGPGLDSWGRHIEILPNNQMLVAGWFTAYNGHSFNRLVRINPDGSPDMGFNPFFGDRTAIYSTARQPDGRIVVTGHSLNYDGLFTRETERLNADGTLDSSYVAYTNEKTESCLLQPDGKVIVAGNFTQADGTPRTSLARFNPDGTLDASFSANIDNFIWGTAIDSNGKLLIAGGFYTVDGYARSGVARLNPGNISGGGSTGGGGVQDVPPSLSIGSPGDNSLTLTWTDSSTIRTGYSIERKDSSGAYVPVASATAAARSYSVSGLAPSTTYYFRLHASNSQGGAVYSNEAAGTTTAVTGGTSGSVTFAGTDSATRGSWQGVYGGDGYSVFEDKASLPSYVSVTPIGQSDWTWQWSTQNAAALQRPGGSDRLAACWYSASSYSIDLNFTDGKTHRTAIYFLDWDQMGRRETVQVTDAASGTILDARTVSSFGSGVYLLWDLSGHVKVTIIPQSGNGVASGIFFGGTSAGGGGGTPTAATPVISPSGGTFTTGQQVTLSSSTPGASIYYTLNGSDPTTASTLYSAPFLVSSSATVSAKAFATGYNPSATATAAFTINGGGGTTGGSTGGTTGGTGTAKSAFVGTDTSTAGNWRGVFGSQGYMIWGKESAPPSYASVSITGDTWIWTDSTSDNRALEAPNTSSRIASCWYSDQFTVDLPFTDGGTHRVSMYLLDWDSGGRSEKVEVLDGDTGAVLQTQTLNGFTGGEYLTWDFKGHVKVRFTKLSGYNAVVSGLFFQASPVSL